MTDNLRLPDFLIIGVAKAATTTLADLLDAHPESAIASVKEPHFFSYEFVFERGLDWYAKLFDNCGAARIVGEASTSYSRLHQHPGVDKRIHDHVPDAKIILMVRHPLERIVSGYIEWLATPNHTEIYETINDAAIHMPNLTAGSRYWSIYSAYRDLFGADNIHVVWFDDMVADQRGTFAGVCRFLGIDDSWFPDHEIVRSNSRDEAAKRARKLGRNLNAVDFTWNETARAHVRDALAGEITTFRTHFGRDDLWTDLFPD